MKKKKLRSKDWFDNPKDPGLTALYLERYLNYGLTRTIARDLGEFNIRVNSVVPGWTITERQIEKWLTPEAEADMLKKQCLKRRLMPSEIAKAILFFSSDQSSGCTNQSYIVDNGWY